MEAGADSFGSVGRSGIQTLWQLALCALFPIKRCHGRLAKTAFHASSRPIGACQVQMRPTTMHRVAGIATGQSVLHGVSRRGIPRGKWISDVGRAGLQNRPSPRISVPVTR